jgi:hypothetical protein
LLLRLLVAVIAAVVAALVQFAYGQTGSGKSYSMVGYGEDKGIVPQAMEEMFARIAANKDKNIKYMVEASMMEIYNEKVKAIDEQQRHRRPQRRDGALESGTLAPRPRKTSAHMLNSALPAPARLPFVCARV